MKQAEIQDILDIQDKDMQMLRLEDLKSRRIAEVELIKKRYQTHSKLLEVRKNEQLQLKSAKKLCSLELSDIEEKQKAIEKKQDSVKKVGEFDALATEISHLQKEKAKKTSNLETILETLADKEEEMTNLSNQMDEINKTLEDTIEDTRASIMQINQEGRDVKSSKEVLIKEADEIIYKLYFKLLTNKRNKVVVPIVDRSCSGCNVVITAQHENVVRRGEKITYCEHCGRIHYWPQQVETTETIVKPKRRRKQA
ncbi:C4-type zinc ribbon domain-containing protein [Chlamydiia bacterium]|nr:C4-type zinc ribbon domain-containing protein [Chlamydiia bacterium]